ncbi:uncharacterized protein LOC129915927 [Episyrphus balteatus]|uniref:uncharacterized protein LOC129915927 n=1 Tax=Episyrphus balteatus TaxID=286459 RepID=UPI0024854663|nr:uncharacterized protein LOC129915927 [Episyrphus balteatus]
MGRYTENDIFKFLELYKRSECLWRSNHKYYRIKSKRNEAYMRIRDAMGLSSILEVKQKIKSFRDTYASERTKVRRSAMTARHAYEVYKPKLRWYNLADSFLNNPEGILRVNCALTVENPHARHAFNTQNDVPPHESEAVYPNLQQAPPAYRMTNDNPAAHQHQIPHIHAPEREPHHQHPTHLRQHLQPQRQIPSRLMQRNDSVYPPERAETSNISQPQSGEFYHFGMNIAMQLSSLPLVQALNVQTKIQQLLCEERIAHEQSRYEIVYDTSHSEFGRTGETNFLVDNRQGEYQEESISLVSTPRGDEDIKEEFSIEDGSENNIPSGGFC